MAGTALPVEVAEQIIDCLSKDRRTLLTCSKVARGWRPRALSYLFHSIQIRDASYTIFSLGHVLVLGSLYFAGFQGTMPHLLLYLRRLSFFGTREDVDLAAFARKLRIPSTCPLELLEFIGDMDWLFALDDLAARIPNLQRLRLESVQRYSFDALPLFGAPALDMPVLASRRQTPGLPLHHGRLSPTTVTHTTLRHLTARISGGYALGRVGTWLFSVSQRAPNLQSIEIIQTPGSGVTERALMDFIASSRPTARLILTLQIIGDLWKDITAVQYNALLTHLKRLRVLKIVISLTSPARDTVLTLLEPLESLEQMEIFIAGAHCESDAGAICDWTSLEDVLVSHSPRFRRLTVTVVPTRTSGITPAANAAVRDVLAARLPRLHRDGKLAVVLFPRPE